MSDADLMTRFGYQWLNRHWTVYKFILTWMVDDAILLIGDNPPSTTVRVSVFHKPLLYLFLSLSLSDFSLALLKFSSVIDVDCSLVVTHTAGAIVFQV